MALAKTHAYGWRRDHPDHRDLVYASSWTAALPPKVERLPQMPACYNQFTLQSCTGCGTARALQYCRRMQGLPDYTPSRLMLYWNARAYDGNDATQHDNGAEVRNAIKGAAQFGACPEAIWPYVQTAVNQRPSHEAYKIGTSDVAIGYRRVNQSLNALRAALASGDPIVFGFSVYESFESAKTTETGICTLPEPNEGYIGGHCVVAVGYDNEKGAFLADNSWGTIWGLGGSFWFPYAYMTNPNLSADHWVVRLVTEPASGRGNE